MKTYCTQNNGDCSTCNLVNYGRDCKNIPIEGELVWIATEYISECCGSLIERAWDSSQSTWVWECSGCDNRVDSPSGIDAAEIRSIRRALNLNTADFGSLIGVSGRTVEDWEQGRRRPSRSAEIIMRRLGK